MAGPGMPAWGCELSELGKYRRISHVHPDTHDAKGDLKPGCDAPDVTTQVFFSLQCPEFPHLALVEHD